jgi:type II secretory ATPase GspE/PulE/Tfp pilus assembly ATPase PilB-like protein
MEASRYNPGPAKVNLLLHGPGAESSVSEESAPKVLENLIRHAERVGASDVHLQMRDGIAHVAFRLDGLVTPVGEIPAGVAERLFGRIKFLAKLKTYQDSLPQDGRIDKADLGARGDIRVATYPTVTGEKIVLRLFSDAPTPALRELNLPETARAQLESFLRQPAGLLLLTGPAGSGKTTTIYACLRHLTETGARHIITIEDPVEQILPGIMQTEINDARGLTFARAARHLLRQDPQVLVLGEIRDDETANLAVRAALTGHLVISTLHAGSCRGVVERLQVMCADRSAVFATLGLVLNQRLLRRLCEGCRGEGCDDCLRTGYKGRLPLVEWERFDAGKAASAPMQDAARELVAQRLTDEAELRRVLG